MPPRVVKRPAAVAVGAAGGKRQAAGAGAKARQAALLLAQHAAADQTEEAAPGRARRHMNVPPAEDEDPALDASSEPDEYEEELPTKVPAKTDMYLEDMNVFTMRLTHKLDMEKQQSMQAPSRAVQHTASQLISPNSGNSNTIPPLYGPEPTPGFKMNAYLNPTNYKAVETAVGQFVSYQINSVAADANMFLSDEETYDRLINSPHLAAFQAAYDPDRHQFSAFCAYSSKKLPNPAYGTSKGGLQLVTDRLQQQRGRKATAAWQQYQRYVGRNIYTLSSSPAEKSSHESWCKTLRPTAAFRSICTPVDNPALVSAAAFAFGGKLSGKEADGPVLITLQQLAFVCFKIKNSIADPFRVDKRGEAHAAGVLGMMAQLEAECADLPGGWDDITTFTVVGKNDI